MYARMVTSDVKPQKLLKMTALYRDTLLPLVEYQPGFKGIFVFTNLEENKEVSITFWENLIDMEDFDSHLLPLQDKITSFLSAAPQVEIFQVVVPEDVQPIDDIALSEASLGIRIEDPFSKAFS
jgi:heme-degrading monooxygenase HmoA